MKTNHEETRRYVSRLTPVLRYVNMRSLAIAMFVAEAFLSTTLGNETAKTRAPRIEASAEAQSEKNRYVCVPVTIKSGRRAVLALDR